MGPSRRALSFVQRKRSAHPQNGGFACVRSGSPRPIRLAAASTISNTIVVYDAQAQLLEMRVRFRRNPEARAWVDRCLVLVARVEAGELDAEATHREVERIVEDLVLRFGARGRISVQ
jgi:hypothetical protein